jgi:hypothetical protein
VWFTTLKQRGVSYGSLKALPFVSRPGRDVTSLEQLETAPVDAKRPIDGFTKLSSSGITIKFQVAPCASRQPITWPALRFRDMVVQEFEHGEQVFFRPCGDGGLHRPPICRNNPGIVTAASQILLEIALRLQLIKLHFENAPQLNETKGAPGQRSHRVTDRGVGDCTGQ